MKRRFSLPFLLWTVSFYTLAAQNDKQVLGSQVIHPNSTAPIIYLIRFQNFGGDTAKNISIRDTLDPRLDFSTFQMVDWSHLHTIIRGGEVVRWYFNDIDLPTINDGAEDSKGYIIFSVRPKQGLSPGQVIRNQAHIYFDGEAIVSTNEAVVWVDDSGAAPEPDADSFVLFPNPNDGIFDVQFGEQGQEDPHFVITDAAGKATSFEAETGLNGKGRRIFLEKLEPGLYFFQTEINGVLQVRPFIVIR